MVNRFSLTSTIFTLSLCLAAPAALAQDHGHSHGEAIEHGLKSSNKPVVYVNDHPITEADIVMQIETLPHMFTSGRDDEIRQAVLERLIQQQLVVNAAKEMGIDNDPEYLSQLKTLKDNLIFNFVISDKLNAEITPARLKQYYDEHAQEYAYPSVKAAHILVKSEAEAKAIIKRLDKGEKFADLAVENSTGPAAVKGGMLGWLARNTMVEPFENAVFALKAGEYTKEPVKTQFGYHVIKVYEVDENHVPLLEELEPEFQQQLSEQIIGEYIKSLEEKASIRYEEAQ